MKRVWGIAGICRLLLAAGLGVSLAGCMQSTKDFSDPLASTAALPPAPAAKPGEAPNVGAPPANKAPSVASKAVPPPAGSSKAAPAATMAAKPAPVKPADSTAAAAAVPKTTPAKVPAAKVVPVKAPVADPPATPPAVAPDATASTPPADDGGDEPLPLSAPATSAAATSAVAVPAVDDQGFPNINAPPAEPSGDLLPPEERKRIIEELKAMRDKQQATKPVKATPAADLKAAAASQDAALKQIEKCSQPDAADDPEGQAAPAQ